MLLEGKLIVVAEGYGSDTTDGVFHVVSQRYDTLVQIYDTLYLANVDASADIDNGLIGSTYLHGSFVSVDLIDGLLSIATQSDINSYQLLVAPFERYNFEFQSLNNAEYEQKVRRLAPRQVELFREALVQDLSINNENLSSFVRINPWVENFSTTSCWSQEWDYVIRTDGLLNGLFFVNTINTSSPVENKNISRCLRRQYF
jgi:hypothetical protein